MDNVYRLTWAGCPRDIAAYVVDEPSLGSSLEGAIRPLIGKVPFTVWNTKPEHKNAGDFYDWRGDCVDVVARFDQEGKMTKLDPGAVVRGMVQPEYHTNVWAWIPDILKKIAEDQDPEWAGRIKEKWSK